VVIASLAILYGLVVYTPDPGEDQNSGPQPAIASHSECQMVKAALMRAFWKPMRAKAPIYSVSASRCGWADANLKIDDVAARRALPPMQLYRWAIFVSKPAYAIVPIHAAVRVGYGNMLAVIGGDCHFWRLPLAWTLTGCRLERSEM
jgi:hypothetical protein